MGSTYIHSEQGFFNSISLPMFPDLFKSRLELESRTWFLDFDKCKIAANAVHRLFLYRPSLQMPWESKHWSANRGKTYPPKITQLRTCAWKIVQNTQQDDLSRNVSNNNYRKLYSLFSLIFTMR